jgi:hypothetical protein
MTGFLKLQNISSSSLPSAADLAKVKHLSQVLSFAKTVVYLVLRICKERRER